MKYIVTLILSLVFFLILASTNTNDKSTKVIITIPNLTESDINHYLKNEFNNLSNIDFVDGSTITNTIVLKVNNKTFNKKNVEAMLNRWGLESQGYAFENIISSSDIE